MEGAWGLNLSPDEILPTWDRLADVWEKVPSPWRASPADKVVYGELAGAHLGGRVLIMGVTPELRDLVAEAGGRAVLFDMSARMHAVTSQLLDVANPADEEWIQAQWDGLLVDGGRFDLVLGDMIWWTVSVPAQREVRDAIHGALSPDGRFVGRFRFTDSARALEAPEVVVERYLDRLDGVRDATVGAELRSWIYDHTANHDRRRLDRERAHALVLELAGRPRFSRHADFLRSLAEPVPGPNWTCQSREELLELVGERFEVIGEGRAEGYNSEMYPVLAFRPR